LYTIVMYTINVIFSLNSVSKSIDIRERPVSPPEKPRRGLFQDDSPLDVINTQKICNTYNM
jgi:hypothetical protein